MPLLVVTVPGKPTCDGERIDLAPKTRSGLAELSRGWPGEVVFVTEFEHGDPSNGTPLAALPFSVALSHDRVRELKRLKPDVVLTNLARSELPILEDDELPVVILAENGPAGRVAWTKQMRATGRLTARERIGLWRLERRYRRAIQRAKGLQLNGYPAQSAYASLNPRPLLFFDSRVTSSMVASTSTDRRTERLTRIAFSGRWLRPKGFLEAINAFQKANARLGNALTLELLGDGDLRNQVPRDDHIFVTGNLDFEAAWIPHVRDEVDVLLIPHTQPDPACTYLEGAGVGTPFVSFDNAAAASLAQQHSLGWVAPMHDMDALATVLEQAVTDSAEFQVRREACVEFMAEHSFEQEFLRRSEHLATCAQER